MIVLGIDPGTRLCGYGVVAREDGPRGRAAERVLDHGTIRLPPETDPMLRLRAVHDRVTELIDRHLPDEVALEIPFLGVNVQSLRALVRVEAAVMLVAMGRRIPVGQYAPAEVKKAVVGSGKAAKEQVAYMVRQQLGVAEDAGLDATDALAVALCHLRRATAGPAAGAPKSWADFLAANPGRVR